MDTPTTDPRPSIVVVDLAERLPEVRHELTTRYGSDYVVHATSSTTAAHHILSGIATAAAEVALVLAAAHLDGGPGADLLLVARSLHPIARRGLLIDYGEERPSPAYLTDAAARGHMSHFLARPRRRGDERFHRGVTEFLEEWWRQRGDAGGEVAQVIADPDSARAHEMSDLLARHDIPHTVHDRSSVAGRERLDAVGLRGETAPVVVLDDGTVLVDPSNRDAARALGVRVEPSADVYDVAIVGGGPAGLAAAVYAASEGLTTAVIEQEALGGQAGTSSLIRNYLGFPRGIGGAELATRALDQAKILGAEVIYGTGATALEIDGDDKVVHRAGGSSVRARSLVIASGVSYARLDRPGVDDLLGRGVFYGAAVSEGQALSGKDVFVVGGGNSAGQAAIHLAKYARHVTMLVRSATVASSMSTYLITEIDGTPKITIRCGSEVLAAQGRTHLESLRIVDRRSGSVTVEPADAVVVLIGGRPRTDWLPTTVRTDDWGYICASAAPAHAAPYETSLPGVFAVGDVRHGSTKRVASAVGEGSAAVQSVHRYLARRM